jgi:hypothetical protein
MRESVMQLGLPDAELALVLVAGIFGASTVGLDEVDTPGALREAYGVFADSMGGRPRRQQGEQEHVIRR